MTVNDSVEFCLRIVAWRTLKRNDEIRKSTGNYIVILLNVCQWLHNALGQLINSQDHRY